MADYKARVDIDSASLGQLSRAANGAQGAISGFSAVMSGDFVNGARQLIASWRNVTQSLSGAGLISFAPLLAGLAAVTAAIKLWEMAAERALAKSVEAANALKDAQEALRGSGVLPTSTTATEQRAAGMARGGDTAGLRREAEEARAEANRIAREMLSVGSSTGGDNERRVAIMEKLRASFAEADRQAKVYESALKEVEKAEEAVAGEMRARELIGKEGVKLAEQQLENARQEVSAARDKLAAAKSTADVTKAQIELERALTSEMRAQAGVESASAAAAEQQAPDDRIEMERNRSQGDYLADLQRAIAAGSFEPESSVRQMAGFNDSRLGEGLNLGRGRVQSLSAREPAARSWEDAARRTADNTAAMLEVMRERLGMAD